MYGQHTADEFWFDRKEGFCEHIASSFVILMRALDIPARIVTGYQGGELNVVDGLLGGAPARRPRLGRGLAAGPGLGSRRPDRCRGARGAPVPWSACARPEGAIATAWVIDPTLVQRMRDVWDAVNNGWNQWVLNYTQGRQLDLLKNLWVSSRPAGPTWPMC